MDAFLAQMADAGVDGASSRSVAARAGASASAINYYFGSIEHLYGIAQNDAVAEAERWLDRRLEEIEAGEPWRADAFPAFAAALIDSWCADRRVQAHAEACDFTGLPWRPSDTAVRWLKVWRDFWTTVLPRFGLDAKLAVVVAPILQSERFGHLARWRAPHDRAGLEEVCLRLAARLSRDPEMLARPTPWRLAAERLSQETVVFRSLSPAAERIADAVVAAVDEGGEGALTHRTAAAKAGLSLGAVTHHFPTRSALMAAGYAHLYQTNFEAAVSALTTVDAPEAAAANTAARRVADHDDIGQHMVSFLDVGRSAPRGRGFEAFFFAATRDPSLADFAARVRYSRGFNTFKHLGAVAPQLTRMDALLISHWISGVGRAVSADPSEAARLEADMCAYGGSIFPPKA
ncbi:TetR family transcriptional regulator [Caulobacter segnis]|uniref:TetR/AcrR family transcriptional regulator n=1 Tax=Caulobacter segnis TaxID=88688 RepID=UPI0024101BDE|nr:TetR family transcriptional regulator [Caulobacter segnis]MDG2520568.1 TetR family transcriptional regulator [Caulobacter segnis]